MAMNWNTQLPPGWEARWNQDYQRYYFIDHATQKTTWTDPRLASVARNIPPVEQIPLQEFYTSRPSTSAQSSSREDRKETSFKHSIESKVDESDEDDEWKDTLLLLDSMMENGSKKQLLFHEKVNMKEKFKREFRELDAIVVENTLEKNDYDEDVSRGILSSLKDAREEELRKKREEQERKRQEENRKAAERKREMEKWKREMKEKKEAEARKEAAAKAEREAKIKAKREARMKAEREAKIKAEREAKIKAEQEAQRKRSAAAAKKKVPTTAKPEAAKTPQQNARPPPTSKPAGRKPVYISPNRLQSVGPQASLRKGPDRRNLIRHTTNASGPNLSLVSGPQMSNRKGPSALQAQVSISKGAQASLRQGPQCRLVHGQERSTLSGQQSRVVSAV